MADFLPRGYLTLSKWTHPTQLHHHRHQEGGPNWGSTTRPLCDSSLALSPRPSNLRVSSCFFITIYIRLKPLKCSSGNDNNDNHNKICFNFIPPPPAHLDLTPHLDNCKGCIVLWQWTGRGYFWAFYNNHSKIGLTTKLHTNLNFHLL